MILINEISLTNFESIEDLHLVFSDHQMTSIRGENGSGKSTLFHAIAFLLFNYKKGDSYRSYVKLGADEAHLEMTAYLDGSPLYYNVTVRAEGRSGTPVSRKVTYKDIVYGTSDYSKFIKDNNLDHLEEIMFLFQDSSSIIEARPSERAAMLRRLFNLDFSSYVTSLKEEQEVNKSSSIEYSTILKDLQSRTYEKQSLTREVPAALISTWEQQIRDVDKDIATLSKFDIQDLLECRKSMEECNRALSIEQRKLQSKISELSRKQSLLESLKNEYSLLLDDATVDSYRENILHSIDINNQYLSTAVAELTEHTASLTDIEKQLSVIRYSISENKKHLDSSSTGVCHACGQPIDSNHLIKLQDERDRLLSSLQDTETLRTSEKINAEELQQKINQIQVELKQLNDNLSKEESLRTSITATTSQIEDLRELIETLQKSIDNYTDRLEQFDKEERELEELEQAQERLRELKGKKQELELKVRDANTTIVSNTERRRINEIISKREKEDASKVQDISDKLNNVQLNMSVNKTCVDIFENRFPNYIILRVCRDLENFINDVVQKAFPYLTVELRADRSGVNFFYKTDTSNESISISMASGAQKRIITLAYQIALASLFNTGAIFLDEIDASMSSTNATVVYDFISSLTTFNQVFFISHRQESFNAVQESNPDVVCYSVDNGVYEIEI